jgi:hypothetical protein
MRASSTRVRFSVWGVSDIVCGNSWIGLVGAGNTGAGITGAGIIGKPASHARVST